MAIPDPDHAAIVSAFCHGRPEAETPGASITSDFEEGWTLGFYSALVAFFGEDDGGAMYEDCLLTWDEAAADNHP